MNIKHNTINYEVTEEVGIITLNRPKTMNAVNEEMTTELLECLKSAEKDKDVRVVMIRGANNNFSSGADLKEAMPLYASMGEEVSETYREHYETYLDVGLKIWDLKKPVIAVVDGYALGVGADWVFAADVAIASDKVKIGEPEILLGSAPPTLLMPWVVGMRYAKEMLLTGDIVDAHEAYRMGMFNKVVSQADLMNEAFVMANKMKKAPETALKITKVTINKIYEMMNIREALDYNTESAIAMFLLNREKDYAKEAKLIEEEGLGAFLKSKQ